MKTFFQNIFRLTAVCVVLSCTTVHGQVDSMKRAKPQYLAVPVFLKSPEMGYGFGVSGSVSFKTTFPADRETRTSLIQAIGFFTTRKQNIQVLDAVVYFPKEEYILLSTLSHNFYPDRFWGLGPRTADSLEERYEYSTYYFTGHLKKRLFGKVYLGGLYEMQHLFNVRGYKPGGVFDTSDFVGKSRYWVSGLGTSVTYDTRNAAFWPTKGFYMYTQATHFNKVFGASFDLWKWLTDIRYYQHLFKGHVLAFQLYNFEAFGPVPLRELASLGGANNMRGFFQGRYRDKAMSSLIMEYRCPLPWRFAICVFGGVGQVYSRYSQINAGNLRFSGGAGIRFALLKKERLNIRIDFGYANKNNYGSYVTVGEAF